MGCDVNLQFAPPYDTQRWWCCCVMKWQIAGRYPGPDVVGLAAIDIMGRRSAARPGLGHTLINTAEATARLPSRFSGTMSFQALPFYQKLGYTVLDSYDLPAKSGHCMYFLQKPFWRRSGRNE